MSSAVQHSQSAALPFRVTAGGLEILLVTSRKRRRWVLPRGKVKQGLLPSASAAREAFEEAGVIGQVSPAPIGSYERGSSVDGAPSSIVLVFSMKVSSEIPVWPEIDARQRRWMSIDEALSAVADGGQRRIIQSFASSALGN